MLNRIKKLLAGLSVMALVIVSSAGLNSVEPANAYAATDAYTASGSSSAASGQPYVKYTIKPGDSLYKISRAYGLTIASLKAANNLSGDMIYAGRTLNIPITQASTQWMSLDKIILQRGLSASTLQISLVIDKSDKLLTVYNGSTPLKAYHVELGDSGPGDKYVAGDHKTPEGSFYITQKLVLDPADQFLGTRWMRLSYPNIEDAQRGLKSGLINQTTYNQIVNAINNGQTPPQNTALGGGIGIHGGSTPELGTNWTYGCTGLTNKDVQDFYGYVKVGTKVTIQP